MRINKLISVCTAAVLAATTVSATDLKENQIEITKGWKMLGTGYDIKNMNTVFGKNSVSTVWTYDASQERWKVYSPDEDIRLQIMNSDLVSPLQSLSINSGFWVLGNSIDTLELNDQVHVAIWFRIGILVRNTAKTIPTQNPKIKIKTKIIFL